MPTPHDALFKHTFTQPEHAVGLLRGSLPAGLASAIDWQTLRQVPGSFVDEALRQHHSDLLFSVKFADLDAYLYLLVEHKSGRDPLTALHLLRYLVRIWDSHHREHPEVRTLPPVVPIVVHHGDCPWTASRSFRSLFDLSPLEEPGRHALAELLPDFEFLLDDLAVLPEESIHARVLSALGRLTLLCLQHIRSTDEAEATAAIRRRVGLVRSVLEAPDGQKALVALWFYVLSTTDLPAEGLRILLAEEVGARAEETVMSTAEKIAREAREKGLAEGRAEGQTGLLLRLLAARFGPLPPETETRLRAASEEQIALWAEQVLTAPTLDRVLAGDDPRAQ